MTTDALNRRSRFAKPQPRGKRIDLQERDYLIFEALDRHGPLPTNYLFEFSKHLCSDYTAHQKRLTKLYNGSKTQGPFLNRPPQQFGSFNARYAPLIYDLTEVGRQSLAKRGRLYVGSVHRTDPYQHRFMTARVTASIELDANACGLTFIPMQQILARLNDIRSPARPTACVLTITSSAGSVTIRPDHVFGLLEPRVGYRFFALEVDRDTECLESGLTATSSIASKLARYAVAIERKAYRNCWGIPNLSVLFSTLGSARAQRIQELLPKSVPQTLLRKFHISDEGSLDCLPTHRGLMLRRMNVQSFGKLDQCEAFTKPIVASF